ncbi:MAG: SDR family NAD(P)-dependent oxidoreductase [Acidobacteria bacterium]|nr:SDR family NAD(P)-dependent oxidoreductase [Acidobacteriota bacterium]
MRVEKKHVLVTGGAHGIGRALCRRFAREGAAAVTVVDLDLEGARTVAAEVDGQALAADVSRASDIERVITTAEQTSGPIDLLCSNAGVAFSDAPGWLASSQSDAQWERIWRINVMAHVWAARAVLPGMIRRGGGYLLHTVSAAGLLNQIGDAAYSTTKHAALGFAESVAITHGDQGIGVSVLCPQAVTTRMFQGEEFAAAAQAAMADGVLTPEEVAEAVVRGLEAESFLILPHPQVLSYMQRKTADYDRWLRGMRRFRRGLIPSDDIMQLGEEE